jgi:hypothetical protein
VADRRKTPSHGYRAVHFVVRLDGIPVEVQVRTELEHSWAQLSEKLADMVGPAVKYGGGPELLRSTLLDLSDLLGQMETLERKLLMAGLSPEDSQFVGRAMTESAENKHRFKKLVKGMIEHAICGRMCSMLFLIQYDRRAGRIVRMERFANDQRDLAAEARLDLELALQRHCQSHEVVLLDAASEEALRKTHGRYFEDVQGLLAAMASF